MNLSLRSRDRASALLFEQLLEALVSRLRPVEAVVQFSNIDPHPVFAEGYGPMDRVRETDFEDHNGQVSYPGDPGYFDGVEELRYICIELFRQERIDPIEFAKRSGRTGKSWNSGFLLEGGWSDRWSISRCAVD